RRADTPAARVPRAELVPHVQHDLVVHGVRPRGERRAEVDEPQPETLRESELQAAWIDNHEEERRRGIDSSLDSRDQVDAEDEAPELTLRCRADCERLDESHLALRETLLPVRLDSVQSVRGGLAVDLHDGGVLGARAATPLLRIREARARPPLIRAVREPRDR